MSANRKNNLMALFLAVLMVIAMMPVMTQEAYAGIKDLDYTKNISGLEDGKIVLGSTISLNVGDLINAYPEMKESFLNYGTDNVEVFLKVYSPGGTPYFEYDKSTRVAKMPVTEDIADAGYFVNVCVDFGGTGGDLYFTPAIDVVERPAVTPAVKAKAANTLVVKGKKVTIKYRKLKKKTQYLPVSKVISFINQGQGVKTYKLASAKKGSKSYKRYFKVKSSTGKITVKKKLKKGTYKLKVKVRASGDAHYDPSADQTVTIRIKVK